MNQTGVVLLILGGLLAAYLISKSGATYSANPLNSIVPPVPTPGPTSVGGGL